MHNYYPNKLWNVIKSNDVIENVCKHIAGFAVNVLGLRHPSAQTKVRIVASLYEAKGLDQDPTEAYKAVRHLGDAFKIKRDTNPNGELTLKVFPENVSEFIRMYPTKYPDSDPPVASMIDIDNMLERSHKANTPARDTNKRVKLKGKRGGITKTDEELATQRATASSSNNQDVIGGLLSYLCNRGSPKRDDESNGFLQNFKDLRGVRNPTADSAASSGDHDLFPVTRSAGFAAGEHGVGQLAGCFAGHASRTTGNLPGLQSEIQVALSESQKKRKDLNKSENQGGPETAPVPLPDVQVGVAATGKYEMAMKAMKGRSKVPKVMKAMKAPTAMKAKAMKVYWFRLSYNPFYITNFYIAP